MPLRLYYCDNYEIPLPPGHKFPMRKYRMLREALMAEGGFEFHESPLADYESIALVHDQSYVSAFLSGDIAPGVIRRIGFPWSVGLVRRTLASVGGTICAAEHALGEGFSGGLAGGTHHAFRSEGAGFCVFNDVAVAIASLRVRKLIRRACVVDLDVHQGDGTAKLFEDDEDVLTISVHGKNNFPFRKQFSKLDVDLPDGAGDAEYLAVIPAVLDRAIAFGPDIIFYQSGVDGLVTDKLGRLALTLEGLRRRDRMVLETCLDHSVPCAITLGGGYSDPVEPTVEAHANTFRTAAVCYSKYSSALKNILNA
ncbi:MAG: histone deacetylase [Bryobacteraceae bacterium]